MRFTFGNFVLDLDQRRLFAGDREVRPDAAFMPRVEATMNSIQQARGPQRPARTWISVAAACAVLVLDLGVARSASADVVTSWNLQVVAIGGPQIQRTLAMVHVAMFDAVNAIECRYTPYLRSLPDAPDGASAEAAAASAAHGVLVRLFPSRGPELAAALAASLDAVPDGHAEADGVAFGDAVALALYTARLTDNILAPGPVFVPGSAPGDYQLTTTTPPQPVNTNAPNWRPFALPRASQFRPEGPPALRSRRYARDLEETARMGAAVGSERSADQNEAVRWHTEMAQFQYNRIARNEVASDGRTLLQHARLFALLNLALADAVTGGVRREIAGRRSFRHRRTLSTPLLMAPSRAPAAGS